MLAARSWRIKEEVEEGKATRWGPLTEAEALQMLGVFGHPSGEQPCKIQPTNAAKLLLCSVNVHGLGGR